MSESATGRSRPSDGRLRTRPSKAIVVDPPASSAMAVTAPSLAMSRASWVFETPALHDTRPSMATSMMRPSASWATAVRGLGGGRPRVSREERGGEERLACLEDGHSAGDQARPAPDRILHVRPPRRERDVQLDPVAQLRLLKQDVPAVSRCLQDCPSGWDGVTGVPRAPDDLAREVLVGPHPPDMGEDRLPPVTGSRGARPPGGRVKDDPAVL